jgi:hypothetical protein
MRKLIVLALVSLLTGCLDDGAELSDEQGALVGGTATAARPEIGTFYNGAGSSCTATLIGPSAILAAAHCLSPQYTATTVASGAVFMFTDLTGLPQSVPVVGVHSFATKRFEAAPTAPFTTDVAVLYLQWAVPASQALPAPIAIQEPYSGEQSTIFGFGCTDRTPQSGGGGKQFFTFNYGSATTALCWGDSGGPVVFGPSTGSGAIWGINSDFNPGWDIGGLFPDSWTDVFADAAGYKKQIEAVIRARDGYNELNANRPGLDYDNQLTATAVACRALCENDGACRAFTWVPEGSQGRCWRKSGAPEAVPGANLVSGLPRKLEPSTNRWGGDYAVGWQPNADACAGQCGRDPQCQAFTYEGTNCWLKNTIPATSPCTTCTSGVARRSLEANTNRGGYDIATSTASSAIGCEALCAQNERCEAYTFTGAASGNCWLKDAVPNAGFAAGMTSGVRRGLEIDTDRPGSVLSSFATGTLAPAVCQAACARDAACQSWTYVPPPTDGPNATCYLRNGVPNRVGMTGYVSGVKGSEFLP